MTIRTQMSLYGFIATVPDLHLATNGESLFYAHVGVEHYRHEADGSCTQLDSTFHNLVAYGKTAERAYDRSDAGSATARSRPTTAGTGRSASSSTTSRRPSSASPAVNW